MSLGKFNIRNFYFYLVCFMSLIIFVIGTVQGVGNLLDIVYPDPQSPWTITRYEKQIEEGIITKEEAKEKIEKNQELELKRNRVRNIKGFIQNMTMVLISIPLFIIHWRKVTAVKEE